MKSSIFLGILLVGCASKNVEFIAINEFTKHDTNRNALVEVFLVTNPPQDTIRFRKLINSFLEPERLRKDTALKFHTIWFVKEHEPNSWEKKLETTTSYLGHPPMELDNEDLLANAYYFRNDSTTKFILKIYNSKN